MYPTSDVYLRKFWVWCICFWNLESFNFEYLYNSKYVSLILFEFEHFQDHIFWDPLLLTNIRIITKNVGPIMNDRNWENFSASLGLLLFSHCLRWSDTKIDFLQAAKLYALLAFYGLRSREQILFFSLPSLWLRIYSAVTCVISPISGKIYSRIREFTAIFSHLIPYETNFNETRPQVMYFSSSTKNIFCTCLNQIQTI